MHAHVCMHFRGVSEEEDGIPAVRFLGSLVTSFVESVMAFGVVPVVFSDPERDPSFQSKVTLAGILVFVSDAVAACMLLDIWRYYHLWPHKAPQIVLQVCLPGPPLFAARLCTALRPRAA